MKRRLFAGFALFALLIAVAVGGHASGKDTRFTDNEDGTVTDITTGLTWQKSDDGSRRNWQEAMDYCTNNNAGLPGSGWRLPNWVDLKSIYGTQVFIGRTASYWSSSSYVDFPNLAIYVNFANGDVYNYINKTENRHVRCVRNQGIGKGKNWVWVNEFFSDSVVNVAQPRINDFIRRLHHDKKIIRQFYSVRPADFLSCQFSCIL